MRNLILLLSLLMILGMDVVQANGLDSKCKAQLNEAEDFILHLAEPKTNKFLEEHRLELIAGTWANVSLTRYFRNLEITLEDMVEMSPQFRAAELTAEELNIQYCGIGPNDYSTRNVTGECKPGETLNFMHKVEFETDAQTMRMTFRVVIGSGTSRIVRQILLPRNHNPGSHETRTALRHELANSTGLFKEIAKQLKTDLDARFEKYTAGLTCIQDESIRISMAKIERKIQEQVKAAITKRTTQSN